MPPRPLIFETYRLNIVDGETLTFDFMGQNIRSDPQIISVLERSTSPTIAVTSSVGRSIYQWDAREFFRMEDDDGLICGMTLGRSVIEQSGKTATSEGFQEATTTFLPPQAETHHLFFYMKRHLVAVEFRSEIMSNQDWRRSLHDLFDEAASQLGFSSQIRLEPVPQDELLLKAFRSFDRLTRLRVKLRIPNPELDRRTERLRLEMVQDGIREYTQDMKNASGLSKSEEGRPFATVAMAQAGYKDGEVTMIGLRNGQRETVKTGKRAARGSVQGLRDFVRGLAGNVQTAEGKRVLARIAEEVEKIVETPQLPEIEPANDTSI